MSAFDQAKFEALQGRVMGNIGGAVGLLLAYIGDQVGVYRALEATGSCSSETLAEKTGLDARYLREWLSANAALGYLDYSSEKDEFFLSPEQAALFSHESEPTCMQGFFQAVVGQFATHDKAVDTFRSGKGRPWGDHHACCFCGTDRFFRTAYDSNLVADWIPALTGIKEKLANGGRVADMGCGHGSSSLLMAKAFPESTVIGFDFHAPSIDAAKEKASKEGVGNVEFEVSAAKDIQSHDFDLVCIFDALHDMGDPVGAARQAAKMLKPDGTFMVVEPIAGDSLAENLNLLAGLFYGFSTMVCLPTSRSQEVGLCLGAQAGEKRLTGVLKEAGFRTVKRATETPTNMVLEARL
ncbi:MAG: class I SAM-dependent methyltransferase [Pseudomonadota bacterium]|nr:class I SAM-dependent methyltransferase [Pseudomonadota bacterium]